MTFTAHGAQFQGLPSFIIINDTVALETIEQYSFSFSNPSMTNGVTLGPNTTLQITDDDGNGYNNTSIYCGTITCSLLRVLALIPLKYICIV